MRLAAWQAALVGPPQSDQLWNRIRKLGGEFPLHLFGGLLKLLLLSLAGRNTRKYGSIEIRMRCKSSGLFHYIS